MRSPPSPDHSPAHDAVKACCSSLYSTPWAQLLLGDSFHPGGLDLTTRLARQLGLGPKHRLLDVASGRGTSALHLARTFGCSVVGLELSATNVAAATDLAARDGLSNLVSFAQGDAEQLPFPDSSFDAVLSECALCTFPDKPRTCLEIARVLKPGGHAGMSDVTRTGPLPGELDGLLGAAACIADAQSLERYAELLTAAGLQVFGTERHDHLLDDLLQQVRTRLLGAQLLVTTQHPALDTLDIKKAGDLLRLAATAVRRGGLGYASLVARKPQS